MSSRRPQPILTRQAQRDYRGIELYTLRQWGPEQAATYMAEIDSAIETLRDHPRIGHTRPDLRSNMLAFPVNHHVLYYRIRGDVVRIRRILHERADPSLHL